MYDIKGEKIMNKQNLVEEMSNIAGISKKDADKALRAFMKIVESELKANRKVQIVGFGTFEITERAAREARNPHTGEKAFAPARKSPKFKAGKSLKNYINEPY